MVVLHRLACVSAWGACLVVVVVVVVLGAGLLLGVICWGSDSSHGHAGLFGLRWRTTVCRGGCYGGAGSAGFEDPEDIGDDEEGEENSV